MVPSTANGPEFDMHLAEAYSVNAEFVRAYRFLDTTGKFHVIGFLNRAHMGSYRAALADAATSGLPPDVIATRAYRSKFGFLLGLEQPLNETIGVFGRVSWNDGSTETWAYTEIDRSFQIGVSILGTGWGRDEDIVGCAFAANGLSNDHRDYLAAGGYGFIIGDGSLTYGSELNVEVLYSAKLLPSFWLTFDNQVIVNPAYNRDRGPIVDAVAIRGHVEF